MGVRATGAERGRQKTSVAYTDRILSRAGVRARRERSPILCSGGAPANVARALLLRNLAGTRSRPSVGAVTQTSDRHTRHSVASVPVKVARAAIEAPASTGSSCATPRARSERFVTGLTLPRVQHALLNPISITAPHVELQEQLFGPFGPPPPRTTSSCHARTTRCYGCAARHSCR